MVSTSLVVQRHSESHCCTSKAHTDHKPKRIIGIALATPATYFLLVPSSPSQPPTTYGNEHEPQPPSGIVTRIDDAKGGVKKRIDSHQQTNIGQGASSSGDGGKDHPMKKQQVGLSNTDTRYSYDVGSDPGKSKKGEGTVDTAKIQGPVDPGRRQV